MIYTILTFLNFISAIAQVVLAVENVEKDKSPIVNILFMTLNLVAIGIYFI